MADGILEYVMFVGRCDRGMPSYIHVGNGRRKIMASVRGIGAVGAALGLTRAVVWGESNRARPARDTPFSRPAVAPAGLAEGRFAGQPVITYRTRSGETLFALQVQPALEAPPAR